ncbi:Hypothetical protein D9617_16g015500 [Elsinoe fawcettii]|nr:Hypothetical protein D9617_16g015500 [Elsinoe fawcettii]
MTESVEFLDGLAYRCYNPHAEATILLIHGAFGNRLAWDLVTPHLSNYHLILPDNPGHGNSSSLPFSVEGAADLFSALIKAQAKGGEAHIVGHSLGAKIAIRLAEKHSELVSTVLISGYEKFENINPKIMPYLLWADTRINQALPRSLVRWAMDGTDMPPVENVPFSLYRQVTASSTPWPSPWPARTLVIAAGKGEWYLPSWDNPHDARKLRDIGKERNPETTAVTHKLMRHPWNRQAPELFAETIRAWILSTTLPDGFQSL